MLRDFFFARLKKGLQGQGSSAVAPVRLQGSSVCNKTQKDSAGQSGGPQS